jgi:serine/threonine protein phosphatase PrpC
MSIELETETRLQLAAAIEARDAIVALVASSRAALARAGKLVAAMESEVQQNDSHAANREAKTAAALVEQLRQGAELTITRPSKTSTEEREAALTRLTVATAARDQIQRETDALAKALTQAEGVVRQFALALVRMEAERIAISVEQHEADLFTLRTKLRGVELATYTLAATVNGTWQRPTLLTPRAVGAMVRPEEPQFAGHHNPAQESSAHWQRFYVALTGDSRAIV